MNYSLLCTYRGVLLAFSAWLCACIGRCPFPKIKKSWVVWDSRHIYEPLCSLIWSQDQSVSTPTRLPWRLSICSLHKAVFHNHSPVSQRLTFYLAFFFSFFFRLTFAGSIISGHRTSVVSTSQGIHYAAARGWYPLIKWSLWGVKALTYHSIISCHKHLSTLRSPRRSWLKPTTLKVPAV